MASYQKHITKTSIAIIFCLLHLVGFTQTRSKAIYSGVSWFDDRGNIISAHGACIIKENKKFYLFGEAHSDTSNAFAGFNCYSSSDLINWKFESIALPIQDTGKLGPNTVGERVKVMKCPSTGEYVMYMHADNLAYKEQYVGYATSKKITGPYRFKGALLFQGKPIKKWDMGSFKDYDGTGYILTHGGDIYKLSEDYKSGTEQVNKSMTSGFESPVIFRKDSIYYFLGSNLSSWERNDNYYFTATSVKGPWTSRGKFTPENSLTWNSQSTFVLPIEGTADTTFMFMGDRWSFPKQMSAATYVWQPLTVSGHNLSIPKYFDAWSINILTGTFSSAEIGNQTIKTSDAKYITYKGKWHKDSGGLYAFSSDDKGASVTIKFKGKQVCLYGIAKPNGGYAGALLKNSNGKIIHSCIIDMYCKYEVEKLSFISKALPKDEYILTVTVLGEKSNWSDKRKSDYGSTGYFVTLNKIIIEK